MRKRAKYYQKRLKVGLKRRKIQVKKRKSINEDIVIQKKLLLCTKVDIIKVLILRYDRKSC